MPRLLNDTGVYLIRRDGSHSNSGKHTRSFAWLEAVRSLCVCLSFSFSFYGPVFNGDSDEAPHCCSSNIGCYVADRILYSIRFTCRISVDNLYVMFRLEHCMFKCPHVGVCTWFPLTSFRCSKLVRASLAIYQVAYRVRARSNFGFARELVWVMLASVCVLLSGSMAAMIIRQSSLSEQELRNIRRICLVFFFQDAKDFVFSLLRKDEMQQPIATEALEQSWLTSVDGFRARIRSWLR